MKFLLEVIILLIFSSSSVFSQEGEGNSPEKLDKLEKNKKIDSNEEEKLKKTDEKKEVPEKSEEEIKEENRQKRKKQASLLEDLKFARDPFKRATKRLGKRKKSYGKYLSEGKYSNVRTLQGVKLSEIRVVGVLLGKNRRAIAKTGKGEETFIIKEGMKIGEYNAEVKAIVPGGILLVEKIKNVYNDNEYIETIIPVTAEIQTN